MKTICFRGIPVCAVLLLGACFWLGHGHSANAPPRADDVDYASVAIAWLSAEAPGDELDSIAGWTAPDGAQWLIATAKRSNRLRVFDGESGEPLRTVGGPGVRPGEFSYPNGISGLDALLPVVERDNHRVLGVILTD